MRLTSSTVTASASVLLVLPQATTDPSPSDQAMRNGSAGWAGGPGRQEGSEKFSNEFRFLLRPSMMGND
jgi:hypothetical protein